MITLDTEEKCLMAMSNAQWQVESFEIIIQMAETTHVIRRDISLPYTQAHAYSMPTRQLSPNETVSRASEAWKFRQREEKSWKFIGCLFRARLLLSSVFIFFFFASFRRQHCRHKYKIYCFRWTNRRIYYSECEMRINLHGNRND